MKARRKIAKALQVSEAQVGTWFTEARAKEGKATEFVAREEPKPKTEKRPADVTFSAADEKHLLNAQKIKREKREKRRQTVRKTYLKVLKVYFPKKYEEEAGR